MRVLETMPSLTLYPSGANFIYFETDRAEAIYEALLKRNILIKRFTETDATPGSIRFPWVNPRKTKRFWILSRRSCTMKRKSTLSRSTLETEISLSLNIDGSGAAKINTALGF